MTELMAPRPAAWVARAAVDWGVIVVLFWAMAAARHPLVYALGILALGTRQHALALLGHDAAHFSVARRRWLNDALGRGLAFWPVGVALGGYRRFHFLHHAHMGRAGDPELSHKAGDPAWSVPLTRTRLAGVLLADLCGLSLWRVTRLLFDMRPAKALEALGLCLWWGAALVVLQRCDGLWIAAVWWVSLLTSFQAVFRLRALTEHHAIPGTHRLRPKAWATLIFLPHNTWCHWEHHKWPAIPCGRLPMARQCVGADVEPLVNVAHTFGWRTRA